MQNDTFANRLNEALHINNLTSAELSRKTKIDKSVISNYLSGNYKAGQDNLSILAEVLNVSEPWLMGYDIESSNASSISNRTQILFDKSKDILSDEARKTIEFIMQKTIEEYEQSKNKN